MTSYRQLVTDALEFIKGKEPRQPLLAIVLGSGLGAFAESLEEKQAIPYSDIPNWPLSTAPGHAGRLVIGSVNGMTVAALQGRLHPYEGYSMEDVTFPVRVLGAWGVKTFIATNASGSINLGYRAGDIIIVRDHINLMGRNPLTGPNEPSWGPRFPDMTTAYSPDLRLLISRCALELGIPTHEGVYLAMSGPSYETPAEIRMGRLLGADVVGMSTVPEVIVARHMGMKIACLSCVANAAAGITGNALTEREVLDTMDRTAGALTSLLLSVASKLSQTA